MCWYMLFNGLTVTQKNTSETDGYLSWKGQSQSVLPFSLPLCHVVLIFFFFFRREAGSSHSAVQTKRLLLVTGMGGVGKPDTDGV